MRFLPCISTVNLLLNPLSFSSEGLFLLARTNFCSFALRRKSSSRSEVAKKPNGINRMTNGPTSLAERLESIIAPSVKALGYELLELEYQPRTAHGGALLR